MKNLRFGFIAVIIFFLITRIINITDTPSSLYWDEASIAVNANSLISNGGKDEWGDFLPIHFRAFGEFKLPVFVYATAVTSLIFGLSELSVRLTSVLFSLGIVLLVGVLTFQLTCKKNKALLAAFVMSISPWFFIFSRTGYEATAGLFFYLAGICSILYFQQKKKYLFILIGTLMFILAMYSYNSYRMLSPLTLLLLFGLSFRNQDIKKYLAVSVLAMFLFGISLVPIVRLFLFDSGFGRAQVFTLFPTVRRVYDAQGGAHLQFIYNRDNQPNWQENAKGILTNYFSHLSPDFLFLSGDKNSRSHVPGLGQLYFLDLIFILISLYLIIRKKTEKRHLLFVVGLLLLSIVPAALFKEAPHALRSLAAAPFFTILIAFGIYQVFKFNRNYGVIVLAAYLLLFSFYFVNYLNNYNRNYSQDWQHGYKHIFTEERVNFDKYSSVVITNQFSQPYIFGLFYLKYPMNEFKQKVVYSPYEDWGFSTVGQFDKYYFMKVKPEALPKGKSLVFTSINDKLEGMTPIKVISQNLPEKDWLFVYEYEKN